MCRQLYLLPETVICQICSTCRYNNKPFSVFHLQFSIMPEDVFGATP
jgi:hypothetical protein